MSLFLSEEEVAELTGIKIGRKGKTRYQLQIAQLLDMGIAYKVNARGRPIVVRALLEGKKEDKRKTQDEWIPGVLSAH